MRSLVAVVVLSLAFSCARSSTATQTSFGEAPLELSLPRYPDRADFSLSSERGHVVLLDVWATWCEPCRESLPLFQGLANRYADQGLRLYAINVDSESAVAQEIPTFLAETKVTAPVLLDADASLSERLLKVKVMPTTLLIDKQGRVRHVHEGFEQKDLSDVVGQLEALLREN